MLPDQENPPKDVLMKRGSRGTYLPRSPSFPPSLPFNKSADMENYMGTLPTSQPPKESPRRPGRPASKLKKVTVTIRIPEDVDLFLTGYSDQHGLFKGDVIADAVVLKFGLKGHGESRRLAATAK